LFHIGSSGKVVAARVSAWTDSRRSPRPDGRGYRRLQKTLVRGRGTEEHCFLMADTSSQSIDVTYVADLARLRLSPEEIATFQKQLSDVLGYVDQLNEVDVSQVSLLGESDLKNVLRADVLVPSLPVAEALANAPAQENNLIVVPRMIES
jgi:aspartyl-tRNA(Asn)/glutamyl-tRNA(Gln) amidotransferase subunit C